MHKSKSRQCQLLNSSNCSHHPFESTCKGLHGTPFSPHTHLLKDTHHLPPSSCVPQRAHGPIHPSLPLQAQTLFTDRHSSICSPCRLTENITASEIKWAKRLRNTVLYLSGSWSCLRSPREMWLMMTWCSGPDASQNHCLMCYIRKTMYLSTATWPRTAKKAVSGSEKAVLYREGLREKKKEKSNPSPKDIVSLNGNSGIQNMILIKQEPYQGKGESAHIPRKESEITESFQDLQPTFLCLESLLQTNQLSISPRSW